MRSGLFLVCYTVSNALMLSMCAVYIILTRDLDVDSDNALVLPLIVAVIPGESENQFLSISNEWRDCLCCVRALRSQGLIFFPKAICAPFSISLQNVLFQG